MREDRAELKGKIHFLEKERAAQELRIVSQNSHLQSLLQSIKHLKDQINEVVVVINMSDYLLCLEKKLSMNKIFRTKKITRIKNRVFKMATRRN